jgi:outer membrane receptor protein involved in Fe transport
METKVYQGIVAHIGLALLVSTAPVMAQSVPPDDAEPVIEANEEETEPVIEFSEEIVVTALKRGDQQLMDVPHSVQVFSGEVLELRQVNSPVDAFNNLIPGASAGVTGGAGTQRYNFRGTGAMGSAGDLAVGFYIDDVPYYSPENPFGPAIRFFDLEALEVLRGPQGTLYGQSAMGGTIIVRTAQPDLNELEARGRLISSDMQDGEVGWRADATVSIPLIKDRLGLRVTAGREERSGLAESPDFPGRENIDDSEVWDYRIKLLYEPSDRLSIRATRWESNDEASFSPVYSTIDPPTIAGTGGIEGLTDNQTTLSSFVFDWETPVGNLMGSFAYMEYDDLYIAGSAFDALIGGQLVPFLLEIEAEQQTESFSQEITLRSKGSGPWDWIMGANHSDGERTANVIAAITSPPGIPTGVSTSFTKTDQLALFGEISRELMDGLITPLVGLRWFRDRREFRDLGATVFETDGEFSTVSPRFNLSVRPSDSTQIYLNVAKGFRSGTFNTQNNVDIAAFFGLTTPVSIPEATLWSYELGARLGFLDGDLLVEPAVYYNDYEDYDVQAQIANASAILIVEEVTSIGVDLLLQYETPIDGLRLTFTGDYNQTEPDDPDPTMVAQVPALANGEQLPYVPQWAVNATATYDWAVNDALAGFAHASVTKRDGQVDFITNLVSPVTDDVTVRFGVRDAGDRWAISLFAKNLTDEMGPAVTTGGLEIRYDRRAIGLELTARAPW